MKRALSLSLLAFALLSVPFAAFGQEAPPTATKEPVTEPRRGFSMSVDLGFAYRHLYSAPVVGGEIEVGIGGALRALSVYGTFGAILGTTDQGLTTTRLAVGASLLFPVSDRVRLGVEPRFTYLAVQRVTKDTSMGGLGVGLYGIATIDVAKMDPGALYAGIRLGAEPYPGSEPLAVFWGGTLSLGFRY